MRAAVGPNALAPKFIGFESVAQVGRAGVAIKYVANCDMVKMLEEKFLQRSIT